MHWQLSGSVDPYASIGAGMNVSRFFVPCSSNLTGCSAKDIINSTVTNKDQHNYFTKKIIQK